MRTQKEKEKQRNIMDGVGGYSPNNYKVVFA
jgi:hypothetical protein